MNKEIMLRIIRREYKEEITKTRKFDDIRRYFDLSEKNEYTLDDQTWDDLDMNRVYEKLDRNYSTLGDAALYTMLRNPLNDSEKLEKRNSAVEFMKNNTPIREEFQCSFMDLSIDRKNTFLDMMESELVVNKFKYYLYTFIGQIFPIIAILMTIFMGEKYAVALLVSVSVNMIINFNERNVIKARGILYLRGIIKTAKKICNNKNEEIKEYSDKIFENFNQVKDIHRNTLAISIINMWGGVFEVFSIMFLLEECAYYSISGVLKEKKHYLMNIFYLVGEVEAIISIAGYKANLKIPYTKPNFIENVEINIKDGVHPLIENAVSNTINIKNNGIVLTGTNMSGKSTFLRMLGVNILLSQTFNFALAKSYEAPFFNIVTSISPNDDLVKGKSYFMAEAEAILRIVKAFEKELPVFCPIDEIFRGTNPVERIAMSAEILSYLNNGKSISIVATHDKEIVNILKDVYEFYYFSENVDNNKGLSFDYKLKKGVSKTRNAIRLLEFMGYPKEITKKAFQRAETIKGFI